MANNDTRGLDKTALALLEALNARGDRPARYDNLASEVQHIWNVPVRLNAFGELERRRLVRSEANAGERGPTTYTLTYRGKLAADSL